MMSETSSWFRRWMWSSLQRSVVIFLFNICFGFKILFMFLIQNYRILSSFAFSLFRMDRIFDVQNWIFSIIITYFFTKKRDGCLFPMIDFTDFCYSGTRNLAGNWTSQSLFWFLWIGLELDRTFKNQFS